jgi:signal transduction histidine kinase/CheY-like chemotaxis protein
MIPALRTALNRLTERAFDTGEKARRQAAFDRILVSTVVLISVFLLIGVVVQPNSLVRRLTLIAILVGLSWPLRTMNQKQRTREASWGFVVLLSAMVSWSAYTSGGTRAPVAVAYLDITLMAGLLLDGRSGALVTAVNLACALAMAALDTHGRLPVSNLVWAPFTTWLSLCLWLLLAALIQRELAHLLGEALRGTKEELLDRRVAQAGIDLALEGGRVALWEQNLQTLHLTADDRFYALYGITPDANGSIDFETWKRHVVTEDLDGPLHALHDLRQGAKNRRMQFRMRRADGSVRDIVGAASSVQDERGQVLRVVGVNIDVTERVKELGLLHQSARLLRTPQASGASRLADLVELMPAAFQFPDVCEARIAYRDRVVATAGWTDTPWKLSTTFVTSEGVGSIEVCYREERPLAAEGPFLSEERVLLESLAEMIVSHEELRRYQEGLETLVTTRTQALRDAKEEAESANAAKSTFLANVSHELRTPLHSITGYAQILRRERDLSEPHRRIADVILRSSEHLLALINEVLTLSRAEAGRTTLAQVPFSLETILAECRAMIEGTATARGLELGFDTTGPLPPRMVGDPGKVKQIVLNLLSNALKFTHRGGIRLAAACETTQQGRYRVSISVADTGPGMSPEAASRLFRRFEQSELGARSGGTGLGLTISREFARMMRGDVTLDTKEGSGSVFTCTFEAGVPGAERLEERTHARRTLSLAEGQRTPLILVADDVKENRDVTRSMLAQTGFETCEATSGEDAIEQTRGWRPDLVVMDLRMPGIGGVEAIRRIRATDAAPPIVAVTASGLDDLVSQAAGAGACCHVLKPYADADLLERICRQLGLDFSVHDEEDLAPAPPAVVPEVLFEGVPRELLDGLHEAALQARPAQIEALVAQIETRAPAAAAHIRALVREFRYREVAAVVSEARERSTRH